MRRWLVNFDNTIWVDSKDRCSGGTKYALSHERINPGVGDLIFLERVVIAVREPRLEEGFEPKRVAANDDCILRSLERPLPERLESLQPGVYYCFVSLILATIEQLDGVETWTLVFDSNKR